MESLADILNGKAPMTSRPRRPEPRGSQDSRLSETMETAEAQFSGMLLSNDPRVEGLDPPAPVACEFCGAPRYTQGLMMAGRVFWCPMGPMPCTCPEAVAKAEREQAEWARQEQERRQAEEDRKMRERIRKIIGESGMGGRFLRRTFESFQITPQNARAARAAKAYADSFSTKLPTRENPEPGRNGLFFSGCPGIGKTHLAAAIANQLMQQGTAVVCMTMIDLLERIKKTYEKNAGSESDVLTLYKRVPLLIIDDMGKEPATEWGISKIYAIINGRYDGYMPTIVTTNYDDQQLARRLTPPNGDDITAQATIDRLREMCGGVPMDGESWRSR